jgi:hypothetical protein
MRETPFESASCASVSVGWSPFGSAEPRTRLSGCSVRFAFDSSRRRAMRLPSSAAATSHGSDSSLTELMCSRFVWFRPIALVFACAMVPVEP